MVVHVVTHECFDVRVPRMVLQGPYRHAGLAQPLSGIGERLHSESPVAPGKIQSPLELLRLILFQLLECAPDFFIFHFAIFTPGIGRWRYRSDR